jgi:hypothetical protein
MNVMMMDNSMPGFSIGGASRSRGADYDPASGIYTPERLRGYGAATDASGDLSLDNIDTSFTQPVIESIYGSLDARFAATAADIRANLGQSAGWFSTAMNSIPGASYIAAIVGASNASTVEQVAGSLDNTRKLLPAWRDRGLQIVVGSF